MSKDYWKDKNLYDKYNERGPGQANDPERKKESPPPPKPAAPDTEREPEKKK
jgi:hypothetical protein